jgi:hypothetical protein
MLSFIIRNDIACLCHARQSRVIGWLGMHLISRRLRLTAASDSVYCSVNEIFLVPVQDRIKKRSIKRSEWRKSSGGFYTQPAWRSDRFQLSRRRARTQYAQRRSKGKRFGDAPSLPPPLPPLPDVGGGDRPRTLARGDSTCNNNIFFSLSLSRSAPCGGVGLLSECNGATTTYIAKATLLVSLNRALR